MWIYLYLMLYNVFKVFLLISDVHNISGMQSSIIYFKDEETEFKSIKQKICILSTNNMSGTMLGAIVASQMVTIV